jgi:hypothetical protein
LQKGIARSFTLGVVIVVIAVIGMAAIFVAGASVAGSNITTSTPPSGSSTTSTSSGSVTYGAAPPSGFGQSVVQKHIDNINARNVAAATTDFSSNGVMYWYGVTQGLGGTYTGQGNIRVTLQTAIGAATALTYTIESFNASGSASNANVAEAVVLQSFSGHSNILGNFNGTIDSTFDYVNQNGAWLIQRESSNYEVFNVQFAQGATTFPQWQITGPPLPFRYSESPFKNFVYFYGGAAAAIGLAGYVATLPLFFYMKKKRGSKRANENRPQ